MALVGEIVARFKAETGDYLSKVDAAKTKNRELATELLKTAGSADKAIASLQVAKGKNALGDFGIDKRQVGGIISEIRNLKKEMQGAAEVGEDLEETLRKTADRAGGLGDISDSFSMFARGDFLAGFEKWKKGWADITETQGFGGKGIQAALGLAAVSMVGEALAKVTDKAVELQKQYKEGAISGGEMADQILRQVPILGGLWATGRNIRTLIGLENDDLKEQLELQNKLYDVRKSLFDLAKQAKEETDKQNQQTGDLKQDTATKVLQNQGKTNEATAKGITDKLNRDIRDFAAEANKSAQAKIDEIAKRVNEPAKEGEKSIAAQLREAQQKANDARAAVKEAQNAVAATVDVAPIENGAGGVYDAHAEALENLKKAQQDQQAAEAKANQLQSTSNQALEERKQIEADTKKAIEERTKALQEAAKVDTAKAFGGKDPKSLDQQELFKKNLQALGGALTDNPVTQWLNRQLAVPLKGNSLADWVKGQVDQGNKVWDGMKQRAAQFRDANKTDVDRMKDQLAEMQNLKNAGLLNSNDLSKFDNKTYKDLIAEQKDLNAKSVDRDVYKLPDVKEVRSGQTLYAPPTTTDEKTLQRLQEIAQLLQAIKDNATNNGITLNNVG